MKKLCPEFLKQCNLANCCFDDFLVLPPQGDVGFEEYVDYKADRIMEAKKFFSPKEEHMLMLAYPGPGTERPSDFDYFFESPSVVAKNSEFDGCFVIDVTDYLGCTEHERFMDLMAYINAHTEIVFILLVYSANEAEINRMYNLVSEYDNFRKISIPLPTAEELTAYTLAGLRTITKTVESAVEGELRAYFEGKTCGYDTADLLIRYFGNEGFDGSAGDLKERIAEYEKSRNVTGTYRRIGF